MSDGESAFSTTRAEEVVKAASDGRLIDVYHPEYKDFLDLFSASDYESYKDFLDLFTAGDYASYKDFLDFFSGGVTFEQYVPGVSVTFDHNFGRLPKGRIILYRDSLATYRDSNWTEYQATILCATAGFNIKVYYF